MFKKSEKFFDIIGEILAVVLVLVYVVLILNANFSFIPEGVFLNILEILRTYGSLILVGVVGLEAMSKRNLVFQIYLYRPARADRGLPVLPGNL